MKLPFIWIVGFALCVAGCAAKAPSVAESPASASDDLPGNSFLRHMHAHAERLDDINFALADGDLKRAEEPAYWLSRHRMVHGIEADWEPYVLGMREAARDVQTATDLEVARAAAKRITEQCQGCHAAAGIRTD